VTREPEKPGYLPAAISLAGRPCLVVGGGRVALRKVRMLLDYGAGVTVIAPEICEEIDILAREGRIALEKRAYDSGDAGAFGLVISAADREDVNRLVFEDCRKASVPVNVVDDPERCDFIIQATVKRGPLTVSAGTQGTAPFFARWVRERLEEVFPEHWKRVALLAGEFRSRVLADDTLGPRSRALAFRLFTGTDWQSVLGSGEEPAGDAGELMDHLIEEARKHGAGG
jgi:siroheme synthase-like protein